MMKHFLLLPLLAFAALLSGCAVDGAYVDGGPGYGYGPGPAYYGGGTTVVAVERSRYRERNYGSRSGYGNRSRTSGYDRGNRRGRPSVANVSRGPRFSQARGGNRGNGRNVARKVNARQGNNDRQKRGDR